MNKFLIPLIIVLLISVASSTSLAQISFGTYSTIGTNPIEKPVFVSTGINSTIGYKSFIFDYKFDLNLTSRKTIPFNAITTLLGYQLQINEGALLEPSIYYLFKPSTELVSEHDFGLIVTYKLNKWEFNLGNNFKFFQLKRIVAENDDPSDQRTISERPGFIYKLKYQFLKSSSNFNFNICVTNYDWFIIEQEINPFVGSNIKYNFIDTNIQLFGDIYYQAAGFNNIRVNYFGFYIRTGLKWTIK